MRLASLLLCAALMAGCTTTGSAFRSGAVHDLVVGQSTLDEATRILGTPPVDMWQQGDTLLARWAHKLTLATDAVYFRQVLDLRFGADGRLLRVERSVNLPPGAAPGGAEGPAAARPPQPSEATPASDAAESAAATPPTQASAPEQAAQGTATIVVPPASASRRPHDQPLLPPGTTVTPAVTYPL